MLWRTLSLALSCRKVSHELSFSSLMKVISILGPDLLCLLKMPLTSISRPEMFFSLLLKWTVFNVVLSGMSKMIFISCWWLCFLEWTGKPEALQTTTVSLNSSQCTALWDAC